MKANPTAGSGAEQARRMTRYAPWICGALIFGLAMAGPSLATSGAGVVPQVIALGDLPAPIRARFKADELEGFGNGTVAEQIVLVKFTVAPGGYFGWHQHGGPVWVTVMEGALTLYDSDDASCTGTVHEPGSAFLDPGDHVHNARNESGQTVVVYATFMLPAGGLLRVDAPDPMVCPF